MDKLLKWMWLSLLAMFTSAAFAQEPEYRPRAVFAQAELDQMLAPIALYPDSLLSQMLTAATYPRDIEEAARWSRDHRELAGEEAVRQVDDAPWDPSVIALVAFPEIIQMMDDRRDWTARLGDAFMAQPDQVMDTVQMLRRRADAAGNLRSTEELVVQRQGQDYVIESPTPEVVYVPYYDARVVYGSWWWPDYQPIYWSAWPGYRYYNAWGWGRPVRIGGGFFFSGFDWRHRYVRYASHRPWYYRGAEWRGGDRWRHNGGTRDARWREGDRDRRHTDNRGPRPEWRDGQRPTRPTYDRRDGSTERREWRGRERTAATPSPAPAPTAQGFFPQQQEATRNTAVRQASPRYGADGIRPEGRVRREQPVLREQQAAPSNGMARPVEARRYVAPQPVQAQAPVQHVAPQPHVAPAPVQRAEPAHPPRAIERAAPRAESNPVERSTRGGFSRER